MITSKQFSRSFNKNNNYNYDEIGDLLKTYDRFVRSFLKKSPNNSKSYYEASMDFYFLETYKRIDFMYKLSKRMEHLYVSSIRKDHFLVKRFHPGVLRFLASENSDVLYCGKNIKCNYYRPLVMLEEMMQERERSNANYFAPEPKEYIGGTSGNKHELP